MDINPTEDGKAGFSKVEVRLSSSGGSAELTWTGQIALAANGSYQFVVYDRGVREQDVVACGNLKYTQPKD